MKKVLKEKSVKTTISYWGEDGIEYEEIERVRKRLSYFKNNLLIGHELYIVELFDVHDEYCYDVPADYHFKSYGEAFDFYVHH